MSERTRLILSFSLFVVGLLWGVSTLLIYIGMPIHQLVYWTNDQVNALSQTCGGDQSTSTLLCRGTAAFIPFVSETVQMLSPLFSYIIVSILLCLGLLGYAAYKTGRFEMHMHLRPIVMIGLFAVSVWLIATTLSFGSLHNLNTPENALVNDQFGNTMLPPFRRFYEPTKSLYSGAGEEAIQELQANYQELLAGGCLKDTNLQTQGGAKLYDLSVFCMQGSIFSRVGLQMLLVAFFLFTLLVLGRFLLVSVLRLHSLTLPQMTVLSFGAGALLLIALLWVFGILGLLQTPMVWSLLAVLHAALFFHGRWWLQQSWKRSIPLTCSLRSVSMILGWLLISYLALNFLNVVRPFPIGWDDLGSYLNRPRLLSSYGAFIPSMSQFQWEYLTSLGFLLFGYDSTVGATFAMQINWTQGLIAVLTIFVVARTLLGPKAGILSAILFYFLPMIGHFSFADMKVDNASFLTTALACLALFLALSPHHHAEKPLSREHRALLILAGLLIGLSFGIKPTAILGALLIFSMMSGSILGVWGFVGAVFLGFGMLEFFGAFNITEVLNKAALQLPITSDGFKYTMLTIGAICVGYAWFRTRGAGMIWVRSIVLFALGGIIACAPWMAYNGYLASNTSISALLKAVDTGAPQVVYTPLTAAEQANTPFTTIRSLPPELAPDPKNAACIGSAKVEELDRYWGFGTGISHYLTLPWRQVMNVDGFGYYVTLMPALLLFPLLLLLPYFWARENRLLRLLFAGTWIFLIQWAFVANGVSWYGIGMFLGLIISLEALLVHAPDRQNKWLFSLLLAMSVVVCLANRMWQFDTQKNLFEYPLGKVSTSALREVTIQHYDDIRELVVDRHATMPDRPYTYRIGTFISYFIPRNREVFPVADHQMQFFNCINQERNHALTLQRLQALGFNGIIFDTNTSTIEKDPNGPLHQKVAAFQNFANDPTLGLQIVVNDPGDGIAYILLP